MIFRRHQQTLFARQFPLLLLLAVGGLAPAAANVLINTAAPPRAAGPAIAQRATPGNSDALPHSGLPNFHQVAAGIYRGAAPTADGLTTLKSMKIHTIIDLRYPTREVKEEKARATALGFTWINLPMGSDPPHGEAGGHLAGRTGEGTARIRLRALPAWCRPHRVHDRHLPRLRAGMDLRAGVDGNAPLRLQSALDETDRRRQGTRETYPPGKTGDRESVNFFCTTTSSAKTMAEEEGVQTYPPIHFSE